MTHASSDFGPSTVEAFGESTYVSWDAPKLKRFKLAYSKLPPDPNHVFLFDGHGYLKSYAKYLIAYLETRLHL